MFCRASASGSKLFTKPRPGERVYSYNNYGRPSAVVLDRFHNLLVKSKLIMFSLKDLIIYTADQMKKCKRLDMLE